ncbi:hypothetical protein OsI_12709 [Oryza sativa Indica Group]|uniref:Uncharacterized protein n=1 Tax=Oryza sativa subsp. indica TaxID=39946 RepID=B8AN16_ORYSI|nr:hypothetical protein OsI_12709 [Oryza sativa Indica Group]
MLQCLEGVKQLCGVLLKCCDLDLKQPKGLEDPEILARETVWSVYKTVACAKGICMPAKGFSVFRCDVEADAHW